MLHHLLPAAKSSYQIEKLEAGLVAEEKVFSAGSGECMHSGGSCFLERITRHALVE